MTVGRPTKYRPEYCQQVIDFMGQGYSLTAFAGSIVVDRDSVYEWERTYPEFSVAVKAARGCRVATLERGLLLDGQPSAQVTARIFALKNACPDEWRDRHEMTGADGAPLAVTIVRYGAEEEPKK